MKEKRYETVIQSERGMGQRHWTSRAKARQLSFSAGIEYAARLLYL